MQKQKVFGVGFQKTGTSSLQRALDILGYNSCGTRPDLLVDILSGSFQKTRRIVDAHDAFFDHPWPQIFPYLDDHYPNSKFILSVRDEEGWYKSVSLHIDEFVAPIHEWIYGRGFGLPKHHKENTLQVYREHQAKVRDYFRDRPESLLVVDTQSGLNWETLCSFLEVPIPDVPFPHLNKSNFSKKISYNSRERMGTVKFYRKKMKNQFMLMYLRLRGWL